MERERGLGLVALGLLVLVLAAGLPAAARADRATPTPLPFSDAVFASPEAACLAALDAYARATTAGQRFRLGPVSQSGAWAYAYAQEVDAGGRPVAERLLALLAHQEPGWGWRALAPAAGTAEAYNALLERFPLALLDEGRKARLRQPAPAAAATAGFGGHHLPWPAGQRAYVTQKDGEQHARQVDFDIEGLVAAGDVYASRPGTVVFVKQSSSQGACDPSAAGWENAVVVQHDTGEYSWYLHLAPGSVPVQVGQAVGYGTRIGREGSTGYACGVHLHYMLSTGHTPWTDPGNAGALPWPTGLVAVDFVEAPWASLLEAQTYLSQNSAAPAAGIRRPAEGATVADGPLLLEAEVAGCEPGYARFVAHYGGAWHALGPDFTTSSLGLYWDMCAAGVADGPVTIGLEVCDTRGACTRLPIERHVVKAQTCVEAPSLQLVQPLALSPPTPAAGQPLSAQFTVRNTGRQPVTLPAVALLAGDSALAPWPAAVQVSLRIYEDYTYRAEQAQAVPGGHLLQPAYCDEAGLWHAIVGGAASAAAAPR